MNVEKASEWTDKIRLPGPVQKVLTTIGLSSATKTSNRLWEVDCARALAIILVVQYHVMYDLQYFGELNITWTDPQWYYQGWIYRFMFLTIVGISLTMSYDRAKLKGMSEKNVILKLAKRGGAIFGLGMIITLVTYFVFGDGMVYFGILHCIGLSIILAYPFLRSGWEVLPFGVVILLLEIPVYGATVDTPYLFWLGLTSTDYWTVDHSPMIPNFGVVLIGIFIGKVVYADHKRSFKLPDIGHLPPIKVLSFIGRHTLILYLIHQPIAMGILLLLGTIGAIEFGL